MVEPKYYVPIIPFALVNGVEGIGTGTESIKVRVIRIYNRFNYRVVILDT
jgi:hypothetical protein